MTLNHAIEVAPDGQKKPVCGAADGTMTIGGVTCQACLDVFNAVTPAKPLGGRVASFNTKAKAFDKARTELQESIKDLLGKRVTFTIDSTWGHSVGHTGEGTVERINTAPRKLLGHTVTVRLDSGGAYMVEPHMVRVIR